jgi:hypothetical protein
MDGLQERPEPKDVELALTLLAGNFVNRPIYNPDEPSHINLDVLPKLEFIESGSAKENEARKALSRVLRCRTVPREVLVTLADVFAPDGKSQRFAVLRNRSKGHPDPHRDFIIFRFIDEGRHAGQSRAEAIEAAANKVGLTPERISEIYDEMRKRASGSRHYKPPPRKPRSKKS